MESFDWSRLLNPAVIWVLIPLAGIAMGLIVQLFRMHHRHAERMAMIEAGIDPDALDRDALAAAEESGRDAATRPSDRFSSQLR